MSGLLAQPRMASGLRLGGGHQVLVFCMLAAVLAFAGGQSPDLARGVVGGLALLMFMIVAMSHRTAALTTMVVWLMMLGFMRRALIPFVGWSQNDPLLMVSPAAAIILVLAVRHEGPKPRTLLSSLIVFQLLWAAAAIFNPNEISPVSGAQGALFFVLPYLWFFVGRTLEPEQHDRVLNTFLLMLVPVLALGYYHTFVGLLPFEFTWLDVSNASPALVFLPGGHVRPFSTLGSPQEYGIIVAIGALIAYSRILHGDRRRFLLGVLFAACVVAIFFAASRGVLAAFLIAFAVVTVVRLRSVAAALVAGAMTIALLAVVSSSTTIATHDIRQGDPREPQSTASAAVSHQISGFSNPSASTLPLHVDLWAAGFAEGLENPLGLGPSRHSLEFERVARESDGSPENEIPKTTASLGLPAGFALVAIYIVGYAALARLMRWQPNARHLAWLGALVLVGDQALNGRLYMSSMFVALILGGASTSVARLRRGPGGRDDGERDHDRAPDRQAQGPAVRSEVARA